MRILNDNVKGVLDEYVKSPYRLNEDGARRVVESNERLSSQYFEHLEFPVSDFWHRYFREKVEMIKPRRKNRMLDVCAGTGTLCLNLMHGGGEFEECIAIDNSAFAVDRLNERIKRLECRKVSAIKDDIMGTRFEPDSFDAIYGNSFLHHLPDNYAFLREMRRILRPGGVVCFTGEPTVAGNFLEHALMGSLLALLRTLRIKKPKPKAERAITDIWVYEESTIREMLKECGFVDVRVHGFGTLVPLFNGPTAYVLGKLTKRSMQPDSYWKYLGLLDKHLFGWLPADAKSHFIICGRKPE